MIKLAPSFFRSIAFRFFVMALLLLPIGIWATSSPDPALTAVGLPPLPDGYEYSALGLDPFAPPPPNAVAWGVLNNEIGHFDGFFAIPGKPNDLGLPDEINPATLEVTQGDFETGGAFWGIGPECVNGSVQLWHLHGPFGGHDDPAPFVSPPLFISGCGHGILVYILKVTSPQVSDLAAIKGGVPGAEHRLPIIVAPGQPFTYGIRAANLGPDAASNLLVIDEMAPGVSPLTPLPLGCFLGTIPGGGLRLICPVSNVPLGEIQEFNLSAVASTPGLIPNSVFTSSDSSDPNSANSSDRIIMGVQPIAATPEEGADIQIAASITPDTVAWPAPWSYNVTVTNPGPGTAKNARLINSLWAPLGQSLNLTSVSINPSGPLCDIHGIHEPFDTLTPPILAVNGVNIVCSLGDMALGSSFTLTLDVNTDGLPSDGLFTNAAGVYHYD
ncbi:MAG: DUF11 domain-containing protein, partial [Chloroflexi bacterium]|nr:DUF11 domain-containing protein [Chloroflexota bacterium]